MQSLVSTNYGSRRSAALFLDGIFASQREGVVIKALIQMERHDLVAFILERQETTFNRLIISGLFFNSGRCSVELQLLPNKQKQKCRSAVYLMLGLCFLVCESRGHLQQRVMTQR